MSPSASSKTKPSSNTKEFVVNVCTIYLASAIPSTRCNVITLGGHTYNADNYALSAPNTVVCSVINSSRESLVTSLTIFLLSTRSPSKLFIIFVFLHVGGYSWTRGLLSWVNFVVRSMHSCVSTSPCMSYSMEISWPSSVSLVGVVVVCAIYSIATTSVVIHCVAAYCSWCFFSSSLTMRNLISLFLCCAAIFSSSTKSRVCQSKEHDAITSNIASSVAMNDSFTHSQAGSLRTRIYRLCISTLNSSMLCKLLYTVRDKCSLWLIHVHKLTSTNAQNTFISWILVTSFVSQSKVYLTASGRFL